MAFARAIDQNDMTQEDKRNSGVENDALFKLQQDKNRIKHQRTIEYENLLYQQRIECASQEKLLENLVGR